MHIFLKMLMRAQRFLAQKRRSKSYLTKISNDIRTHDQKAFNGSKSLVLMRKLHDMEVDKIDTGAHLLLRSISISASILYSSNRGILLLYNSTRSQRAGAIS